MRERLRWLRNRAALVPALVGEAGHAGGNGLNRVGPVRSNRWQVLPGAMAAREKSADPQQLSRLPLIINIYGRVMSGILMLFGLYHWAVILGLIAGPAGMFEDMPMAWKLATIHLAVADLVASVGLWQRAAWGNVIWVYAALSEIAMHTLFMRTFGADYLIVAFHAITVSVFFTIVLIERRGSPGG